MSDKELLRQDNIADITMLFKQIISLTNLMLENSATDKENILTIHDLATFGYNKATTLD